MAGNRDSRENEQAMGRDPLGDDEDVLGQTIFGGEQSRPLEPSKRAPDQSRKSRGRSQKARRKKETPDHYKVISISLYNEDIAQLDKMVKELKRMGHTKANRSALIRFALDQVNIEDMPRSY